MRVSLRPPQRFFFRAYPFFRVEIQVLNLPVLEETSQTNAIIRKMRLLANNNNVVFSPLDIVLHEFLAFVQSALAPTQHSTLNLHEGYAYHPQSHDHYSLPRVTIIDFTLLFQFSYLLR